MPILTTPNRPRGILETDIAIVQFLGNILDKTQVTWRAICVRPTHALARFHRVAIENVDNLCESSDIAAAALRESAVFDWNDQGAITPDTEVPVDLIRRKLLNDS